MPSISQRIADNLIWTIRKLIMCFPHPIASVLLQLARKLKSVVSKPAPELIKGSDLLSDHNYVIRPLTFSETFSLKQPQTIVVVATKDGG